MILCQNCATENSESAITCRRCGAPFDLSPTQSISSEVPEVEASPLKPSSGPRGFAPGSVIADRYRVTSMLGRGGMGEVYAADDLKLSQRVALKFLPAERLKSSSWRDQFYAEVRMARLVSHPSVCRMYDVGECDGRLFLSMEFVDGEDLASLLRRIGRLPDDKAVEVAQQLCAGLGAAHSAGVLHRDLKPSNVMLDGKGRARITDFGLAVAASDASGEKPAGTPGYMAPELMNGAAPTVQSDLYALGLVLYEVFTGKRAFDAPNVAELYRRQSETNPTPPSNLVKNFDSAVEHAILRCLDRDPAQRPRSAQSVAAALPGGDPLAAALAAGETPSPEMVAAAGPQGSLRPPIAWACLLSSLVLILGTSVFLAPKDTDWGLSPMPKSPEVLTDRARELARKLGYASAVDRAAWIDTDNDLLDYASDHPNGKDWKHATEEQVWPSTVGFWYRQSPQWMEPTKVIGGPPRVTALEPPHESAGMATIRLDMQGNLLFLRGVPPQVDSGATSREPDWSLLFAEAGLDKTQFTAASPKWTPPDAFDSRADWEGRMSDHPDLPLHVTAAAFHGVPVYFQVIAPWDKPWRSRTRGQNGESTALSGAVSAAFLFGVVVLGAAFARWNLRRGRGDGRGAVRLMAVAAVMNCLYALVNYHFIPKSSYISYQFLLLAIPLLFAVIVGLGYVAVEPYSRRSWPKLMVSWQRLLSGRLRDPLVGRDILLGVLAAAVVSAILLAANALIGMSEVFPIFAPFGSGTLPSVGASMWRFSQSWYTAMERLAVLTIATGVSRKKWLGIAVTGLLLVAQDSSPSALDVALTILYVVAFMFVLVRLGLIAATSFLVVFNTLAVSPPLNFSQWYAGRAVIALLLPVALLVYGFYISLGGQPMFGRALDD